MARTTPAGIASLVGVAATRAPLWLMDLALSSGTQYYSSGESVSYNGHTYAANRISNLPSLEAAFIDRKTNATSKIEIEIDNLANDGSSTFPITALNASVSFEDAKVTIYCYSPDASTAVIVWWGFVGGCKFSGDGKTATISASFFWNSLELPAPAVLLQQKGFQAQEAAAKTSTDSQQEALPVPVILGAGAQRVWPIIYNHWSDGYTFHCEFVLSGLRAGFPFNTSDLQASDMQLFGVTPATTLEWYTGSQVTAPTNLTRFPENNAHFLCAFGYVAFPITAEIKDRLDNVQAQDIRALVQNGRPLADTSLPSENGPLMVRELLGDPVFGVGIPTALFDSTVLTSTANYVGTRYQLRYELAKQMPLSELVQRMLGDFHGFITFDDGLIQVRAKRNTETSQAVFVTCDATGRSGRKIHNDFVDCSIKDSSELINQVTIEYRRKFKNRRIVTLYDPNAQTRAGGTYKKVVDLTIDETDICGLYDETQAQINAAITVREEQNGNLFIAFSVPIWDGINVSPGDVITVWSPDIVNNASNNLFRVTKQTIGTSGDYLIDFECQVYKTAIYNDDASGLGVDLLRGGEDTNAQGRPPDGIPISLTVTDIVANDTEGKDANLRFDFTVPAYDPTADIVAGVFIENKISEFDVEWRFVDEPLQSVRFGNSIKVTQQATPFNAFINFTVPYYKSRSVEAYLISIGPNRARVPVGLIPDATKVTTLTANLSATGAAASVAATGSNFNANDYCQIEKEQLQVLSKTSNSITFINSASVRTPQFGTASIAHPSQTEIAVLKQSYPSLIRSLLQARFTYPTVTARDILQRGGDGVRVRWIDVSPDNLEQYTVAVSVDADAGTNVNKLGSAAPAWYLSDPLTPPSGVTLYPATGQKSLLIPQEDIGVVGTQVFARVYAKNGKRNFSAALSALLNSSVAAAGGTSPPTDVPSGAHVQYVVENVPEMTPEGMRARFRAVVDANGAGNKTYAQTGATSIVCLFQTSTGKLRPEFFVDDPTQTRMEIQQYFTLGELVTWTKNVAWNAGGSAGNASSSYQFRAGVSVPSLAGLTGFSITSITAIDEKHSYINFGYTQPAIPCLISHALIMRQLAGESSFTRDKKIPILSEPNNQVAGAKTFTEIIKHPKKNAAQYKIRLVSVDGTTLDSAVFNNTSPDVDTGPPNNGTAITLTHAAVKNGRTLIVRFTLPTLQMASHVRNTLIIHDNNATGAGRRFFEPTTQTWVATYSDGSTELDLGKGSVPAMNTPLSALSVGGRTTIYIKVGVYNAFNGSSATYSTDVPGVGVVGNIPLSGVGAEPADADIAAPTLASPSAPLVQEKDGAIYCSAPPPVGNIKTFDQIRFIMSTQNTAPVSAAAVIGSEGVVAIKHGDTVTFRPQRPQLVTLYFYYEARNQFNNGTYSVWSTGTSLDPSGISRPLKDFIGSGVPALPMALERATTSGTGHTLTTFTLDAGASGLPLFYFSSPPMILYVPSLNAGDSVRNIVGYNPVTKIVSVDTPFSATPANSIPFEIHRGLPRGGKSGTGHTTGFFFLDAGASPSDGVYAGMMIYIPSAPTAQKLFRVTAYVGSTRRCTLEAVETALSSAPANNCGYMLSTGSFGYANFDGSGTIAPVCYRVWRDNDTAQNVVEPILPTGENAYSMDLYHAQVTKKGDGSVRFDEDVRIGSSPVYRFAAPGGYTPMIRITFFLNAYRESASDGKSASTYYAIGFGPSTGVGAFLPGTFIPPFTDYRAQGNYPAKYSSY